MLFKKTAAAVLVICMLSGIAVNAGLNTIPELTELNKTDDAEGIEKFIMKDERDKIDSTASVEINVNESNITREADRKLLGVGGEGFHALDKFVDQDTGELVPEWKKLSKEIYRIPMARFGGHDSNMINLLDQVGTMQERKALPYKKDINIEEYYPNYGKPGLLGSPQPVNHMGTVEFIKLFLENNPDCEFIFTVSITHAYPEDNANFVRFCLDDKDASEWGALRASCGIEKPINLVCIELGNELYNNPDYGETVNESKRKWYVETCKKHIAAIREYYPDMKCSPVLASNGNANDINGYGFDHWNPYIIKELGPLCDVFSFHWYYSGYELAYNSDWAVRTFKYIDDILGPDNNVQLALTEQAKWCTKDYFAAATMESGLATAAFLNRIYNWDNKIYCANYYHFSSDNLWALVRKDHDGKLIETAPGMVYRVYDAGLGDRVIDSEVISDESRIGDDTFTGQQFTALVTAEGDDTVKIIMSNRAPYTDINVKFNFNNNYTLTEETVMRANNQYSLIYNEKTKAAFSITTTPKNESGFTSYKMPNESLVTLTLKSDKKIPKLGSASKNDGEITFEGDLPFADIDYHWAKNEISLLSEAEVVSGDGIGAFRPDEKITRAEAASLICKGLGTETPEYGGEFNDVFADDWFAGAAKKTYGNGYMKLKNDNCFDPNGAVTMQEAVESMYRICGSKLADVTADLNYLNGISISEDLSNWSREAVAYAVQNKLIDKMYENGTYDAGKYITRAEAAVMIYRIRRLLSI